MDVAKVRAAPGVKLYPDFEPFNLQILQVDVAFQIERVQILNANSCQQPIDLSELLSTIARFCGNC